YILEKPITRMGSCDSTPIPQAPSPLTTFIATCVRCLCSGVPQLPSRSNRPRRLALLSSALLSCPPLSSPLSSLLLLSFPWLALSFFSLHVMQSYSALGGSGILPDRGPPSQAGLPGLGSLFSSWPTRTTSTSASTSTHTHAHCPSYVDLREKVSP